MRYAILIRLLLPLAFVFFWWRGRQEPAWREAWLQRLGGGLVPQAKKPLWVHMASVGEANSASSFLRQLAAEYPDLPLHLTAFTPTGAARLREIMPSAQVSLLPLDVPSAFRRFLRLVQPRAVLVLETECWPNMLLQCERQQIPVIWLSGRLSESTVAQMPKLFGAKLMQRVLGQVKVFGLQTELDAERFARLGAPETKLTVTGSLKFDLELPEALPAEAQALRQQWGRGFAWLAASTHPGEEELVLQAHKALLQTHPEALLVLAPRHPRRRDEVLGLIAGAGLSCVSRSEGRELADEQVLLVDTLGELMLFYAACDLSLVAGSLQPIGGHNLLEPAALQKPILSGPHLQSCRDVADALLERDALVIVEDAQALHEQLLSYLDEPIRWRQRGEAAASFAKASRGAVRRSLALLRPYL